VGGGGFAGQAAGAGQGGAPGQVEQFGVEEFLVAYGLEAGAAVPAVEGGAGGEEPDDRDDREDAGGPRPGDQ
jgi:hypothetical protein